MTARPRKKTPPYRVVVSADYRLAPERRWVLTAPIVSMLEVDTMVARPAPAGRPRQRVNSRRRGDPTYVPWLSGPIRTITAATLDALGAALRTEMDL